MKKWTEAQQRSRLFYYILFLFALTFWLRLVVIGLYKVDCGGSDENVIFGIQRILMGMPLYQNPSLPDYAIIQYTPLYYYIAAAAARILHLNALNVQGIYITARVLNLIFNLLTIVITARILRDFGLAAQRLWTFALPVIIMLTTHYYTRIDSLQLLLFAGAMAVYISYLRQAKWRRLMTAALLCGACVMTKQNGMLATGILGFSLLFGERKLLAAILFGALSAAAAAAIAWLCPGGNWMVFYQNAYLGLKNGVDWTWPYTIFISQFYYDLILCYSMAFIIAWHAFRFTTDKVYRFIGTGAVLSFLFAFITGFKIGSSNNYFTEELLFVLLGLPVLLQSAFSNKLLFRIGKWPLTVGRLGIIAFFVLVTSKTMGFFTSIYIEKRLVSERDLYENDRQLRQYFMQQLHLQPGEYIYFTKRDFLDNFFIGNSVMGIKDVIAQTWKGARGTFDYSALEQGMNNGMIRYVVMRDDEQSINQTAKEEMPMMQFDTTRFRPLAKVNRYIIYQYSAR